MYKESRILVMYRNGSPIVKAGIILLTLISLGCIFLLSAFIVGSIVHIFADKSYTRIYYGFKYIQITLPIFIITSLIVVISLLNKKTISRGVMTDERGVTYSDKGSEGTAHPATKEEKEKYFTVCDLSKTKEMILGQETTDGKEVYAYKRKEKGAPGTRHVLVFAPSGGGKTYSFVLTNVLQVGERGDSIIVVDPDASIFGRTSRFFVKRGYDVKLLNCANLEYSDCWDCLSETIDESTQRVDSLLIQSWAKIFVKNSEEQKNQDFWYGCAVNLIETVIGYIAYRRESFILSGYKSLYRTISDGTNNTKFEHILNTKFVSFPWCEKRIMEEAEKNNVNLQKVQNTINKLHENAPAYTISEVYEVVNNFTDYESKFENIPDYHPGKAAYGRYKSNKKDAVKEGAIQGAQMKFKIFDNELLRKVLSTKGIDFKTINKRKSAYYMALPDNDTVFQPIGSLFFSFFFRDAQRIYDKEARLAEAEHRKNECIPVMAMMDEFASLGVITGDEKMFGTIMSDVRKRQVTCFIIAQYYAQLELNYGRFVKRGIEGNCDNKVCLGAGDEETAEVVSRWSGVASTIKNSHKEADTLLGPKLVDNETTVSESNRYVYTPDEIAALDDKVFVKRRGCNAFICNPVPWEQHPAFKNGEIEEVSYFNVLQSNAEDPWEEYDRELEKANALKKQLKENDNASEDNPNMDSYAIDEKTGELIEEKKKVEAKPKNKSKSLDKDEEIKKQLKDVKEQTQINLFEDYSSSELDD